MYSMDTGRGNSREGGGGKGTNANSSAPAACICPEPGASPAARRDTMGGRHVYARERTYGRRDETRPVSTGGETRRVQSVREGGGGGRPRADHCKRPLDA